MPIVYHMEQLPLFPQGKICLSCQVEKPLSEFYKESQALDGHKATCIACTYIRQGKDPATRRPIAKFKLPKDVDHKVCNRCKIDKPFTKFSHNRASGDGYKSICKDCGYASTKAFREANKELHKAKSHESYVRNVEHKREYRIKNAERTNIYFRNRRATDPEYSQRMRDYRTRYAAAHRKQMHEYYLKWLRKYPLKNTEYTMRYNARKKGATIDKVDYEQILLQSDMICYICEQQILPQHSIEFDHVIPLTRQGTHSSDNIQVVHDKCNSRKSNKLLEEMTPFQRRGIN